MLDWWDKAIHVRSILEVRARQKAFERTTVYIKLSRKATKIKIYNKREILSKNKTRNY